MDETTTARRKPDEMRQQPSARANFLKEREYRNDRHSGDCIDRNPEDEPRRCQHTPAARRGRVVEAIRTRVNQSCQCSMSKVPRATRRSATGWAPGSGDDLVLSTACL